jgi:hypothetical protein
MDDAAFVRYHGRERDESDPPAPFLTWEEWQRTAESEERRAEREYIRGMV